VAATRLGGGAAAGRGITLLLAALGAGHLILVPASAGTMGLSVAIAVAGTMIAPVLASSYAMVDDAAPAGTVTEAFAWLATAVAIGAAAGAAIAGAVAESAGPEAALALAGAAGAAALLAAAMRASTLVVTAPLATTRH
jgi:hypothetical protein